MSKILGESGASDIASRLGASRELASLWDPLRAIEGFAVERYIAMLPELVGFTLGPLPWSLRLTAREQVEQAKSIGKSARALNRLVANFAPLDPFGLHQFYPRPRNEEHFFLVGLGPIASIDPSERPLLLRLAHMVESFRSDPSQPDVRPRRQEAVERFFVRQMAKAIPNASAHPAALRFLAELANEFNKPAEPWTADRVRQSLRSAVRSGRTKKG